MKRTIVKIIGITISIILLSQSLNVFAVTKRKYNKKKMMHKNRHQKIMIK